MKNPIRVRILGLVLLASCGRSEPTTPDAECTVIEEPGGAVVRCGDGSSVRLRDGADGASCTVLDDGAGTKTIVCDDGTSVSVSDGRAGTPCSVAPGPDGATVIACADGTGAIVRDGRDGTSCTASSAPDGSVAVSCQDGTTATVRDGARGTSCTVTEDGDGSATIACEDGTTATLPAGEEGTSCSVSDNGDGSATIACEDGTTATLPGGDAGSSCSVTENGDGSATIACEDGTTATLPAAEEGTSCTVTENGDGSREIVCDDGTTATVTDGRDGSSCSVNGNEDGTITFACTDGTLVTVPAGGGGVGAITGTARMLGEIDNSGIQVSLGTTGIATMTDADGTYELRAVPSGIYALAFERIGYQRAMIRNAPVLAGTFDAGEVVLRIGRLVDQGEGRRPFLASPAGDSVLFFRAYTGESSGGELALLDLQTDAVRSLGLGSDTGAVYSPDGGRVAFRRRTGLWAERELVVHDVQSGAEDVIATGASGVLFSADGSHVLYMKGVSYGIGELWAWDVGAAAATQLSAYADTSSVEPVPGGRFVLFLQRPDRYAADLTLVRWDLATGTGTTHGAPVQHRDVEVSPRGTDVQFLRGGFGAKELVVLELSTGAEFVLGAGVERSPSNYSRSPLFGPDGLQVAFSDASGTLTRWDVPTRTALPLTQGAYPFFSPDGQTIMFGTNVSATRPATMDLNLWDVSSGASVQYVTDIRYDLPPGQPFSPDCRFMAFYRMHTGSTGELAIWDIASQTATALGPEVGERWQYFTAGSERALFLVGPGATGERGTLQAFDLSTSIVTTLGYDVSPGSLRETFDPAVVAYVADFSPAWQTGTLTFWDFGLQRSTAVAAGAPRYLGADPQGRHLVFNSGPPGASGSGELRVVNVADRRARIVDDGVGGTLSLASGIVYGIEDATVSDRNGLYIAPYP